MIAFQGIVRVKIPLLTVIRQFSKLTSNIFRKLKAFSSLQLAFVSVHSSVFGVEEVDPVLLPHS